MKRTILFFILLLLKSTLLQSIAWANTACPVSAEIEQARQELREAGLSSEEIDEFMGAIPKKVYELDKARVDLKKAGLNSQQISAFLDEPSRRSISKHISIHVDIPVAIEKSKKVEDYFADANLYVSKKHNIYDVTNCCSFNSSDIKLRNITEDVPSLKRAEDPSFWSLPVDELGRGFPRGHSSDPYYIGNDLPKATPKEYVLLPEAIGSKKLKPVAWLDQIELVPIKVKDGLIAKESEIEFYKLLEDFSGVKKSNLAKIPPELIGEGSFHYVFNICPKGKKCFVMKLKKTLAEGEISEKAKQQLLEVFIHDAYMEEKHEKFLERVMFIDPETNEAAEFVVNGFAPRGLKPGYPKKQLAEIIPSPFPQSVKKGVLTQDLIPWKTSNPNLVHDAHELKDIKHLTKKKEGILQELMSHTKGQHKAEYQTAVDDFLDRFINYETKTGPDIASIDEFLTACKNLGISRTVLRMCGDFRSAFNIPDDFEQRVLALEQSYRDSAAEVLKDRRKNFKRVILGNADLFSDSAKEVGYDLNHGTNVMWLSDKGMFGIPDR